MKKILLVEDDKALGWLLAKILERKYKVVITRTVLDAYSSLLEDGQPDLIISDINLPDINGLEFIENASASDLYKDIPKIIITALPEEVQLNSPERSFNYLLAKPFNPHELLSLIEYALKDAASKTAA